MPIDYERRFIFIHIPKTAGTSVLYNLFNIPLTKDEVLDSNALSQEYKSRHLIGELADNNFIRTNHYPLYKIANSKNDIDVNEFFIFTFVRNPFDRIVSEYHYFRFPKVLPFKDYVKHILQKAFELNKLGEWFSFHLLPQFDFISIDGKIRCDFVGRFESLEEDYSKVCEILSIEKSKLPHYKKSDRKDYRSYYDDELRRIIEKYYKKDFEEFNYQY